MLSTKIVGNKIAEARKKVNISQAQLADRLFISPQAVGKWERGESMPDIITFNRLAEILGVDFNYFSDAANLVSSGIIANEFPDKISDDSLSKSKKHSWDMSRGNWVDADFSGLKNLHEKFSSSNMQRCRFIGSNLSKLILKSNNIENCDFSGSDIGNSNIQGSNLNKNVFKDCSLKETEISGSNIGGCDFTGADFSGTEIKNTSLVKNIVTDAVWNHTSFIGSALDNITFEGSLEDCYFENCSFSKVTFLNATLTNTFFKNKSLRRIRFIDCQADRMTYEFLKNGKADLSGIKLIS